MKYFKKSLKLIFLNLRWTHPNAFRSDLFRKALALSNERAETLLKHGFKSYSEFGRICPVTLEKKGLISESTLGKFPVVLENHVYWLKSKKKLHEFKLNPSCYLKTTHLLPYVPSVVLMTGPPLSGKTTLGKSLAMDLGVPYFHFPTLLVSIIQESSVFFSTLRSHLQSGGELSAAMASKTIDWVIKRSPAGCVLDDIVTDIDRVPDLVIQSDFTFPELLSRAHASSWGEYLVKQKLEVYEGHWIPLLNTWQKHFDQVIKLPTHLSKWHQKFEMTRDVFLRLSKIRAFQYAKSQQLPFSAYQVGLHKENVIHQKSLDYCPVSLKFGFRDLSPTSWKFSCFYKDVVYHCCSSEHQSLFLKDPSYYLDQDYPTEIPQLVSAEKVADSFPEKVEFKGYCPVTLRDEKKCVDGSKNCALRFSGKLFFMSDEDAKMKFIRNPEAYATFISTMKLPVRQPAIPLSLLPPSDYLLRTLSALLIQIFHQLGKFRPILPFQSPTQSAVSYIALSLNAQNPRFSDHRRKYWTQLLHRYSDDAEILTFLTREIQKQNGEYGNPSSFNSTFKKKLNEFFSQSRLQR
ncbi:adenylate kinase [Coelomomyces lativittatus]|nr:adenylate kinase [Coelomomyces lativittatus]